MFEKIVLNEFCGAKHFSESGAQARLSRHRGFHFRGCVFENMNLPFKEPQFAVSVFDLDTRSGAEVSQATVDADVHCALESPSSNRCRSRDSSDHS